MPIGSVQEAIPPKQRTLFRVSSLSSIARSAQNLSHSSKNQSNALDAIQSMIPWGGMIGEATRE